VKQQLYNKAYEKYTPDWFENKLAVDRFLYENNRTLIEYFDQYTEQFMRESRKKLRILDLGCGFGGLSIYLHKLGHSVLGLDISELAILGAKQIATERSLLGDELDYKIMDVTKEHNLNEKFDMIIDSHLLHCLTSDEERSAYFDFVKKHLGDQSRYLLETMAFQKGLRTPIEYTFGDDHILYKSINKTELPIRKILSSYDLEQELKHNGLNINYLYFHAELTFQIFTEEPDYPYQHLPQTIRLAANA